MSEIQRLSEIPPFDTQSVKSKTFKYKYLFTFIFTGFITPATVNLFKFYCFTILASKQKWLWRILTLYLQSLPFYSLLLLFGKTPLLYTLWLWWYQLTCLGWNQVYSMPSAALTIRSLFSRLFDQYRYEPILFPVISLTKVALCILGYCMLHFHCSWKCILLILTLLTVPGLLRRAYSVGFKLM